MGRGPGWAQREIDQLLYYRVMTYKTTDKDFAKQFVKDTDESMNREKTAVCNRLTRLRRGGYLTEAERAVLESTSRGAPIDIWKPEDNKDYEDQEDRSGDFWYEEDDEPKEENMVLEIVRRNEWMDKEKLEQYLSKVFARTSNAIKTRFNDHMKQRIGFDGSWSDFVKHHKGPVEEPDLVEAEGGRTAEIQEAEEGEDSHSEKQDDPDEPEYIFHTLNTNLDAELVFPIQKNYLVFMIILFQACLIAIAVSLLKLAFGG